jgi:hypothetical protein
MKKNIIVSVNYLIFNIIFRYFCQLHFLIICHIHAYYMNRTVIFKDIDPKNDSNLMTGHIKLSDDINRFHDSYLPFSSCNIVEPNTVDIIDVCA